jgi:hypothetical protein
MIAQLHSIDLESGFEAREPRAIGEVMPEVLARYGIIVTQERLQSGSDVADRNRLNCLAAASGSLVGLSAAS